MMNIKCYFKEAYALCGKINQRVLLNNNKSSLSTLGYSTKEVKGYIKDLRNLRNSYMRTIRLKIGKPNIKTFKGAWYLCVGASVVFVVQRYIICVWTLEGLSNEPTFGDGDIILVCIPQEKF